MNLEAIAPLITENIQKALAEKRYPFGVRRSGLSNKIASKSLYNSVSTEQTSPDVLTIYMNEYWQYVQSGRLPGKRGVPVEALEKWIKERGLTGRDKKGRFIKRRSFAFAIQTSIKKFGIPASNFLDVAVENIFNDQRIINELGDSSLDDLINLIEGI